MPANLLKCVNLHECDKFFEERISDGLLGDWEPGEGVITHLSGLIAHELESHSLRLQGSLSLAVFLVWMGWFYYQEGNYWGPVYKKLGLSPAQIKWQGILGDAFLQAVRKYNLPAFQGKLRYISPILAHGYVPKWHMESYFEDVVLEIYKDRGKLGIQIKQAEIEHLIFSWCRDYEGYEEYQNKVANIELAENKLLDIYEAWKHKDTLLKLQYLQRKLISKAELVDLLAYPEDWLVKMEKEQAEYREQYYSLQNRIEDRKIFEASLKNKNAGLKVLEGAIKEASSQILEDWNEDYTGPIMDLPVNEINKLAEKVNAPRKKYIGFKGWLLRLFAPAKYRQFCVDIRRLTGLLDNLPVKQWHLVNPWPVLPEILSKLQDLLRQRKMLIKALAEINAADREAAAANEKMLNEELKELKDKLDKLTQQLAGHKTQLVRLGKGDLEKGKEVLADQRKLLPEIDFLRAQIPGDADALIYFLHLANKYPDVKKLERRITRIRKRKEETREHLKIFKNPLYTLNESTRIFILQGGEKAVKFVYESLLLIDGLQKGKIDREILLPNRFKQAMQHWWEKKGKNLLESTWEEEARERDYVINGVNIRKPVIQYDPIYKEIKVVLQQQPVRKKAKAKFYIQGESGKKQEVILPLGLEKGIYWSEATELTLEYPEQYYYSEFNCGSVKRSFRFKGIGLDNICMLFNMQGELVIDGQLPEDGVYIITPVGSSVDPVEVVMEQLSGFWSGYECRFINLDNNDVVAVRTGDDVTIYRRLARLKPTLLSRDKLHDVTAGNAMIYQGQLPNLLFSLNRPEEIQFYGLRLDTSGETVYRPLQELKAVVDKNNVVYLPLAGLSKKEYGLYKISLVKRGNIIWSEQCAVIPDLKLIFDRQAYVIQDDYKDTGELEFYSKHKCEFIPNEIKNNMLWSISPNIVKFDTRHNIIQGNLVYHFKQKLTFDINVPVPGIRWRHIGTDWRAETEEVWHEDLGDIEVKVPATIGKTVKLSLEGDKQVISSPVRQGIAVFNLRRFSDTLRASNKPLQKIVLSFSNTEISPFILLRVRTRWQVSKVNLTQLLQNGNRHLLVEWEELGRAANRVVRFWPMDVPGINHIEKAIPDGINSIDLTVPVELMPPGRYRLQLAQVDPWSNETISFPEHNAENCKDIDIGTKEEQLESYLGKRLEVIALYNNEQEIEIIPETYYWLEVTELNPTFEEEVRLMGNVYSTATDGTIVEMPFNPVSFYISDRKMPFLIDKDGDGVTYCRKCKVMFWEVAHKECGDAVFMPDIILVKVRDN